MWEAPDACEECEPQVVASRSYCRNCGLVLDPVLTGTSGTAGPLWARPVAVGTRPRSKR